MNTSNAWRRPRHNTWKAPSYSRSNDMTFSFGRETNEVEVLRLLHDSGCIDIKNTGATIKGFKIGGNLHNGQVMVYCAKPGLSDIFVEKLLNFAGNDIMKCHSYSNNEIPVRFSFIHPSINIKEDIVEAHLVKNHGPVKEWSLIRDKRYGVPTGAVVFIMKEEDLRANPLPEGIFINHMYCRISYRTQERICFDCRQPGHVAKNCPDRNFPRMSGQPQHAGSNNSNPFLPGVPPRRPITEQVNVLDNLANSQNAAFPNPDVGVKSDEESMPGLEELPANIQPPVLVDPPVEVPPATGQQPAIVDHPATGQPPVTGNNPPPPAKGPPAVEVPPAAEPPFVQPLTEESPTKESAVNGNKEPPVTPVMTDNDTNIDVMSEDFDGDDSDMEDIEDEVIEIDITKKPKRRRMKKSLAERVRGKSKWNAIGGKRPSTAKVFPHIKPGMTVYKLPVTKKKGSTQEQDPVDKIMNSPTMTFLDEPDIESQSIAAALAKESSGGSTSTDNTVIQCSDLRV